MSIVAYSVVGGVLVAGTIVLLPILKTVSRIAPYAYPNARVRAMRAQLVKHDYMSELAHRPYTDVVYALEQHIPELARVAGPDTSFAALETGLRSELVSTLVKLRRISPQELRKFLNVMLSKYDIQVIESIVRVHGAAINVKYDILHATEVFSHEFITRDVITLEDLQQELRGTVYEDILSKYMDEIQKGEYAAFETELDHLYFTRLLHAAPGVEAKQYAKRLIDIHNVSLALKELTPTLEGGKVKPEDLSAKDLSEIVSVLQDQGYAVDGATPAELERNMQINLKKWSKALMAKDPLSQASIIGYLILKIITTRNITILLKLKQSGLKPEEILEVLAL